MAKFTNKTPRQPLGIGSIGLLLEPGETKSVSVADAQTAGQSPVVQAWVASGMLEVSADDGDQAEAERLAQEAEAAELARLEAEENAKREADDAAKGNANTTKTPTPAPKK